MFESLSTRLQDVFKTLRGETRLTPENIEAALREIRLALLEADVNFKVVKAFIDRVRDRAMEQEVLRSLSPAQQVVKIVRDEMVALFGNAEGGLQPSNKRPRVVLWPELWSQAGDPSHRRAARPHGLLERVLAGAQVAVQEQRLEALRIEPAPEQADVVGRAAHVEPRDHAHDANRPGGA